MEKTTLNPLASSGLCLKPAGDLKYSDDLDAKEKNSESKLSNSKLLVALFVAPDGNDCWSGTSPDMTANGDDGPFATLQRARDEIRELKAQGKVKGPVSVSVRGGTYYLREPLVFSPEDSGTPTCPVTYCAYRDERPVISGGRRLNGWQPSENGLWTADASGVLAGDGACRQLFLNGRRIKRARQPREGYFQINGVLPKGGKPLCFPWQGDDIKDGWADGHTEIVILQNWFEMRHTLLAIDTDKRQAILSGVSSGNGQYNPRYWLENVLDALDEPETWCFDWRTKRIYYRPLPVEDMARVEAAVPVLECLILLEGDLSGGKAVEHVNFTGFTFCHTAWTLAHEGYNDLQAAFDIHAAVRANAVRNCCFDGCRFAQLGGYAVEWSTGCQGNRVMNCEITDMGAGGIKIGEPLVYENQNNPRISRDNVVTQCHIHDIGIVYPAAAGIWIGQSGGNAVSHNDIHDTYYTGISVGWTWGYGDSNAKDNILAHNHIHDIGRGMLSDMGGIYLLGKQPGTVICNNVIHDISSYEHGYGGWGIYLDEGCTGVLVENNLVYRTQSGGFHQHYGRENMIRNNIFAFSREGQILRTRQENHLSFTMERNIIYCDHEFPLSGNWSNGQYHLDRNLYFRQDGSGESGFYAPLVYLGSRSFPNGFLGERLRFDLVGLNENAMLVASQYPELRCFGVVPYCGSFPDRFPPEDEWTHALLLPNLVNVSGQEVWLGETETRMLRTKHDLYVRVFCQRSRFSDRDPGMSNDAKQENVELFLKPDLAREACVQLYLKVDGTMLTYYHHGEGGALFRWDGRSERTPDGWRALFRIPLETLAFGEGDSRLCQIFVGRYALLPPLRFRDWQQNGQDRHSIIADPLFRAVEQDDFRLREDSPALGLGFQQLDGISERCNK
jgi:hypothetical protein